MHRQLDLDDQYDSLISKVEQLVVELQKHHRIRMVAWIKKFDMPINNSTWKQNRNLHVKVMIEMISANRLVHPFDKNPPEGPLQRLNVADLPYPLKDKFIKRSKSKSNYKIQSQRSLHKKQNIKPNFSKSFNDTQDTKKPLNSTLVSHRNSWNKYYDNNQINFQPREQQTFRQTIQLKSKQQQLQVSPKSIKQQQIKSNYQECLKISQQLQQNKTQLLFKKTLNFLLKNENLLSNQHQYKILIQNLTSFNRNKNSYNKDASITLSPSQSKITFGKYYLKESHLRSSQSVKFMSYLNQFKPKFI